MEFSELDEAVRRRLDRLAARMLPGTRVEVRVNGQLAAVAVVCAPDERPDAIDINAGDRASLGSRPEDN